MRNRGGAQSERTAEVNHVRKRGDADVGHTAGHTATCRAVPNIEGFRDMRVRGWLGWQLSLELGWSGRGGLGVVSDLAGSCPALGEG